MATNARSSEKRTATTTDPRPSRIKIGTDGEGAEHFYMPHVEAVVVIEDGERAHRANLDEDNPIEQWVTFVGDRRGWRNQRLYETFGDAMADSVSVERDQEQER
jgi:hypothetical protein